MKVHPAPPPPPKSTYSPLLKSLATQTITSPLGYISTGDTLSFYLAICHPRPTPRPKSHGRVKYDVSYVFASEAGWGSVGGVASQLRSALDPNTSNLAYNTRALATLLNRMPDKNCYELDSNIGLGKPGAVRRLQFGPVESLIYLMPRTRDGEIVVAICLMEEDMERLRADKEFARYGRYIG
ncbi:hypothetical protein GJ744_007318 [Endocarpon pusillum]|uniref:Uncharacterized protein n=1 Tax=Endocarpon pusillum TaxID=364733 RepID=A0A8H7AMB1_9EURO|nr:hypothetical protein GJ744_007318 [Endocarpon pusillum]